ncbi:hypothetical protein D5F01_LYC12845 [Larimichthys crocea]|uniref:Uncharacterized protein n=1 Tax=Larimichthys crocea TaxID=215358 RepID=A0A6G0IC90_LARCR|nr:hypothetical protein D5F01_LYC12845 [Larimichthys crocea]
MSITEAPDMTVASSSPWRCCGRQRKTSLGETGDTKEEYDMRRTKKGGKGAYKKPVYADIDSGKYAGIIPRLRARNINQHHGKQTGRSLQLWRRAACCPKTNLTHGDGQTDGQSDANCLHCQSHSTTPPPVAMGNPPHHGNQLASLPSLSLSHSW